jgi:hypothetical protein
VADAAIKDGDAPGLGQNSMSNVTQVIEEDGLARPFLLPDGVDVADGGVVARGAAIDMGIAFYAKGMRIGVAAHEAVAGQQRFFELVPQGLDGLGLVIEEDVFAVFLVGALCTKVRLLGRACGDMLLAYRF